MKYSGTYNGACLRLAWASRKFRRVVVEEFTADIGKIKDFIKFLKWCKDQWKWWKIQTPIKPRKNLPVNPILMFRGKEKQKMK